MDITFFGAARTVTGSMHRIQTGKRTVLLDCGLFQGKRKEAFELNRQLPIDPASIDAVFLSHSHIDHSGNIPTLIKNGFRGTIYATQATCDLCSIMLPDSGHLQERDVEFVNKKRAREGKKPFEPLYTSEEAKQALSYFQPISYEQTFRLDHDIETVYHDAGHILGSAMIEMDITCDDTTKKVVYSGDIGRPNQPILRDPWHVDTADVLIMESTYGGRLHEGYERIRDKLLPLLHQALETKSKIIIPSFSVGRTQHLVYLLHKLWKEKVLPPLPVYVDSPLSVNATDIFKRHAECYDEETLRFLAQNDDPFGFAKLTYIRSLEDSKALNEKPGPYAIISASGMCEGGRILHHLAHTITDPDNIVLIIGFQAENTLGRRIVEKRPHVKIFGSEYPLRATVETINAFSGHADQKELLEWIGTGNDDNRIKKIFIVHGEEDQSIPLSEKLKERGFGNIVIPQRKESRTIS